MEWQQDYKIKRAGQTSNSGGWGDVSVDVELVEWARLVFKENLGIIKDDPTYFYFWSTRVWHTDWRIKRLRKSDLSITWAHWATDPDTAWANRATHTYNTEIGVETVIPADMWIETYWIDKKNATNYYFGENKVGSTKWRIKRMNKLSLATDYAKWDVDGLTNWNNRTSLTYNTEI